MIKIPYGVFASDDEVVARRKRLAEALRKGEVVSVMSSGETIAGDASEATAEAIVVPEGKLAR